MNKTVVVESLMKRTRMSRADAGMAVDILIEAITGSPTPNPSDATEICTAPDPANVRLPLAHLPNNWGEYVAGSADAAGPSPTGLSEGLQALTTREREIAHAVATGMSNRTVAATLFLSPKTVEHHLSQIYAKLNVASRTQLAHLILAAPPTESDRRLTQVLVLATDTSLVVDP